MHECLYPLFGEMGPEVVLQVLAVLEASYQTQCIPIATNKCRTLEFIHMHA